MSKRREFAILLRNGIAFSFSWLVICILIASLIGDNESISVKFLIKLFFLCLWGTTAFACSFKNAAIQKKGFIFSLAVFYILFIPVETVMFSYMGILVKNTNVWPWLLFGGIVLVTMITSILIDVLVMKKKGSIYTAKLAEYNMKF